MRDACEKIQHFGAGKDAKGEEPLDDVDECLKGCEKNIEVAKVEFSAAEKVLRRYYGSD